ncbi:MAG: hypothetical protein ABSC56_04980 [Solirubrobacteraceae bacterium]|jgi:hypothetical protein
MRNYWVFTIGTAEYAPPEDWLAAWRHHTEEMWFPPNKRPTGVKAGDRAVIHGTLRRGFIAVVEVVSTEPERNTPEDEAEANRWPWKLRYKLLVAIRADSRAPSLEDVGWENPRSLLRQPHKSMSREMYERIADAIIGAAGEAVAA